MIVSSEAAADVEVAPVGGDDRVAPQEARSSRLLREYGPPAMLALVVGALAVVMYSTHRAGHWWGDDWALYIRQAKGLLGSEAIKWNFTKFLIDRDGKVVRRYAPQTVPSEIEADVLAQIRKKAS